MGAAKFFEAQVRIGRGKFKDKTNFGEMQMAWVWPIYLNPKNVNKYNVSLKATVPHTCPVPVV